MNTGFLLLFFFVDALPMDASGPFTISTSFSFVASIAFFAPTSRKIGETPCTFIVVLFGNSCTASESLITLWQCTNETTLFTNFKAFSLISPFSSSRT